MEQVAADAMLLLSRRHNCFSSSRRVAGAGLGLRKSFTFFEQRPWAGQPLHGLDLELSCFDRGVR